MDLLPVEIVNEILIKVNKITLYNASQVCKEWRLLSLKQVTKIMEAGDFHKSYRQGDLLTIIRSRLNVDWINNGLLTACLGGHKPVIELMIAKGANDWNVGLYGACLGGSLAIVELMIAKGANSWNNGLHDFVEEVTNNSRS